MNSLRNTFKMTYLSGFIILKVWLYNIHSKTSQTVVTFLSKQINYQVNTCIVYIKLLIDHMYIPDKKQISFFH